METLNRLAKKPLAHWTEQSTADFVYRISSDFTVQVEKKMEREGIKQNDLATKWGVTPGRVSQIMNSPGNLELATSVQCARALGMKVALVAYEDGDTENQNGPINSEVFAACWQRLGAPRDFFELATGSMQIHSLDPYPDKADNTVFHPERYAFTQMSAGSNTILRVN
jgi:predicted XRE-type DNA-binding protein